MYIYLHKRDKQTHELEIYSEDESVENPYQNTMYKKLIYKYHNNVIKNEVFFIS